ncbi:MAG: UvrD-helicase domain-containing protein, partial [Desulfovibrionales bacterium]
MNDKIRLISASAGSGKTFQLTREMAAAVQNGVNPENVVATTFTVKAANELAARVQKSLLSKGSWDQAQRLLNGYIGTVNSVCDRLLSDYCFEAGLSPHLEILTDGDDGHFFAASIAPVIQQYAEDIEPVAHRFSLEKWTDVIYDIIKLARTNGLSPDDLIHCGSRSLDSFRQLYPAPSKIPATELDQTLAKEIKLAISQIDGNGDGTNRTKDCLDMLKKADRALAEPEAMPWVDWVRLAKIAPGKKSKDAVVHVISAALAHLSHPRFHTDAEVLISSLFACASEAMRRFAEYKKKRGVIDFVDQESLVLNHVLKNPEALRSLQERLDIVLVDEFQDTSPIQLAIFLELTRLAGQSIWVGDQKQAIYGFRGSDPVLMDAVIEKIVSPDKLEILPFSWRSCPSLVAFTSELFARAFKKFGMPEDQVRLSPKRKVRDAHNQALQVWKLDASKKDHEYLALAAGVKDLLGDPEIRVEEETQELRGIRPGDVAILCRTNDNARKIADALQEQGIKASVGREGLLACPEIVLALAGLRYLVNPRDTLALAEILHLTSPQGQERDWLWQRIETGSDQVWKTTPSIGALDTLRPQMLSLTPSESLDAALAGLNLEEFVLGWDNADQRRANLELLRGLACEYEDLCRTQRTSCTASGLISYLYSLKKTDKELQAVSTAGNSVSVLTYHKSKGLEWPIVILADLDASSKDSPFGLTVESPETFNPKKPLDGRWIRYWPWAYAGQKQDTGIEERLEDSPEQKDATERELKERIRLLYVGMTRPRDHLILTARLTKGKLNTTWLDSLEDETGTILELPLDDAAASITIGDTEFPAKVRTFSPVDEETTPDAEQFYVAPELTETPIHVPAFIIPSKIEAPAALEYEMEIIDLGDPLPIGKNDNAADLGRAIHSFFATAIHIKSEEDRISLAKDILDRWMIDALSPEDLNLALQRLEKYLSDQYGPDALIHTEYPIHCKDNGQKASGWIDLLLKTDKACTIIDHKSFHGPESYIPEYAKKYIPQLGLYSKTLQQEGTP